MAKRIFQVAVALVGIGFAIAFVVLCVPPFVAEPDLLGAFGAGFVNPYASGYSLDTVCCWLVLAIWVIYERIPWGWSVLIIGIVPGVATGFALYLLLRLAHQRSAAPSAPLPEAQ